MKKGNCEISNSVMSRILTFIGIILLLLYTFTISHVDCNTITTWAYDLLNAIKEDTFKNYPVYTYETHNMATNYTLFSNVINAIWLLPVYLTDVIGGFGFSMTVYDVWYKVFILIITIASLFLMSKVLDKMQCSKDKKIIGLFVMSTSALLLNAVLGKGQIDIFDMLFVILSIYLYLDDRIEMSFLSIGIGCLFKPFIILLGVPYLCLMIGRCKCKSFVNGICLIVPYILNTVITNLLMPRYGEMKDITSQEFAEMFGMSRVEQIFNIKINSIYVFIGLAIIICAICLYIGIQSKTKEMHLVFYPTLMFIVFGVFVDAMALYWFVVLVPLLTVMGLNINRLSDYLLLNIGINTGVTLLFVFMEKGLMPAKNYSIIERFSTKSEWWKSIEQVDIFKYSVGVFATLFITSALLISILYFYEKRKKNDSIGEQAVSPSVENKMSTKLLLVFQAVPQMLYLIFVYTIC